MPSLTRTDAALRADTVRIDGYDVDLDLRADEATFRSRSTARFTARPGTRTFVDVRPRRLHSVVLNGRSVDVELAEGRLVLDGLAGTNELVVDADMPYSHDGEGLCRSVDPADGQTYLYAMSFLDAAPRWFACFDQPDLKAPLALTVRAPENWTVAGNAPAQRVGRGEWRVDQPAPLAPYVATLLAGPYATVTDAHDGIPFALHARASLRDELDHHAGSLLSDSFAFLDEYHRLFGMRYPWGEYHQAFVPDFNAGAMENPGCVTIRDDLLFRGRATDAELAERANIVAHEMAHMWFGDLVTMRWWDDLWLNESFAEYLGFVVATACGYPSAWTDFGIATKAYGQAADRRPSTHPVAANAAADAAAALTDFDGISYAKGAALLRQLAARLGEEAFFGGLRRHIADHAFGNADLTDLLAAWTATSGVDVSAWSDAWLRTTGMDSLGWEAGSLSVRSPDGTRREHAVTVASFGRDGSLRDFVRVVTAAERTEVALTRGPLILADARDETWAKIELADATWQAMPELLPGLRGPERVVVWNALRLAVADAEVPPDVAVQTVVAALPVEDDDAVLESVARWAVGTVTGAYLSDDARPAALQRLAAAAEAALLGALPGSGRALAAARAYVAATADERALRSWLAGQVPNGIVLDVDLRWAVVRRLCELGAMPAEELAEHAGQDRTTEGEVHAARCAAARPDPAAKQAAWHALMRDPDVSNSLLYATARGFWQPGQQAVTDEYVPRYFAEVAGTAAFRSGWVLGRVAGLAYPRTAVLRSTVEATDRLLARADLEAGTRRAVVDAGDDLSRAVRARERFRAGR